jgi:hypothetical protein
MHSAFPVSDQEAGLQQAPLIPNSTAMAVRLNRHALPTRKRAMMRCYLSAQITPRRTGRAGRMPSYRLKRDPIRAANTGSAHAPRLDRVVRPAGNSDDASN